jgi:hypothetical protein
MGSTLVTIIQTIVFVLPLCGLLWKLSRTVFNLETTQEDLKKFREEYLQCKQRQYDRMDKIDSENGMLSRTMGRIEEKLNAIIQRLDTIERKQEHLVEKI